MKRVRPPKVPQGALKAQIGMLQGIVSALVARMGGHVEVGQAEIDASAGDAMEFTAGPEGFVLHIRRKVRVVSGLN